METIETIRRRIGNAEDLGSIVRTMKAIAAASIRHYERAVEALADYNRTTDMGLHVLLNDAVREGLALPRQRPKPVHESQVGVIIFGTDQGMAGQFNEVIGSYTLKELEDLKVPAENRSIIAIGARIAARLEDAGQNVLAVFNVPTSVSGITPMVQELLLRSERWRREYQIDQVFLFYNRLLSTAAYRPRALRLLPINVARLRHLEKEPWPTKVLPTFTMDWDSLFSALLRQHLFVSLFRAFAESLASENASRLVSMQAAERNIEERLDELRTLYHQRRQDAITGELLDIVSGFEALTGTDQA